MTDGAAHLRRNREGVLLADGLAVPVRFVIDGRSGKLVFPADGTVLEAEELVLCVPREAPQDDHELQLLLSAGEASEEASDRWRAYHGQPRFTRFGSFGIEGGKFDGVVMEQAISPSNPVVGAEGKLCKRLNTDTRALGAACRRLAGVEVRGPLAVGVDAFGVDVKARFGIVRIEFPKRVDTVVAAEQAIEDMLKGTP